MKTFIVNGKEYTAKETDFEFWCNAEEIGLTLDNIGDKPMATVREYLSFCGGVTREEAAKEITNIECF